MNKSNWKGGKNGIKISDEKQKKIIDREMVKKKLDLNLNLGKRYFNFNTKAGNWHNTKIFKKERERENEFPKQYDGQ